MGDDAGQAGIFHQELQGLGFGVKAGLGGAELVGDVAFADVNGYTDAGDDRCANHHITIALFLFLDCGLEVFGEDHRAIFAIGGAGGDAGNEANAPLVGAGNLQFTGGKLQVGGEVVGAGFEELNAGFGVVGEGAGIDAGAKVGFACVADVDCALGLAAIEGGFDDHRGNAHVGFSCIAEKEKAGHEQAGGEGAQGVDHGDVAVRVTV